MAPLVALVVAASVVACDALPRGSDIPASEVGAKSADATFVVAASSGLFAFDAGDRRRRRASLVPRRDAHRLHRTRNTLRGAGGRWRGAHGAEHRCHLRRSGLAPLSRRRCHAQRRRNPALTLRRVAKSSGNTRRPSSIGGAVVL